MPEANVNAVQRQLQQSIDRQEAVKRAAREAAEKPASPPTTAQEPAKPQGGAK